MGCGALHCCNLSSQKTVGNNEVAEPALGPGAKPYAVVVWGAHGLQGKEGRASCLLKVGNSGTAWKELPRGRLQRSEGIAHTSNPEWKMVAVFDLAGLQDPEVHLRVYSQDLFCDDDCIGECTILTAKLPAKMGKIDVSLGPAQGFVTLSGGHPDELQASGLRPNARFPTISPPGQRKACMAKDVGKDGPMLIGKAPMPKALRGLFWLTNQGAAGSVLASFGGPSNDGGGCSTGQLLDKRYKIRCAGDRTWADANDSLGDDLYDLMYHFVFDDAANPTRAAIYPQFFRMVPALTSQDILDFEMELLPSEDFPKSVVWLRKSSLLGVEGESVRYQLVQILDEHGARIEPAFGKFVQEQENKQGGEPGKLWYRQI